MATVNSDILILTLAGIKTEFNQAYIPAMEKARWKDIASEIPTTLPIQKYGWLGRGAVMRAFPDEAEAQSVVAINYTLADIIFKGNLQVSRQSIEDDQYGEIMMRARDLAQEPVRHWNQLAYLGLANGFSSLCYDGQFMFSASHQQGSSPVQSNLSSAALSDTSLEAAEAAMMAYVDDKGLPLEIEPDTLVVGPALRRRAATLLGSDVVVHNVGDGTASTGATAFTNFENYFKGKYKLVVNPYLIGTAGAPAVFNGVSYQAAYNWFLLDTKRGVKPIVIQSRSDVPITLETDMDQPSAKIKEIYDITARGRYVQGYGLWQTAFGSNATA